MSYTYKHKIVPKNCEALLLLCKKNKSLVVAPGLNGSLVGSLVMSLRKASRRPLCTQAEPKPIGACTYPATHVGRRAQGEFARGGRRSREEAGRRGVRRCVRHVVSRSRPGRAQGSSREEAGVCEERRPPARND